MIKLRTKVKKGEWFLNKNIKKKKPQWPALATLTRTQKIRKQRQILVQKIYKKLGMLEQARNALREKVQSPKRTNIITTIKMVEKVVGSQAKAQASKGNYPKTLVVNVDMVSFINVDTTSKSTIMQFIRPSKDMT